MKILRAKGERTVEVKVREASEEREVASRPGQRGHTSLGPEVRPVTPEIACQLNLRDAEGVVVVRVDDESPAAAAGVQRGDVVREINRQRIRTIADFERYYGLEHGNAHPPLPAAGYWSASALWNNKLYVIGGANRYDAIEAYDPASSNWEIRRRQFVGFLLRAVTVGNHIYVLSSGSFEAARFGKYDPARDLWSPLQLLGTRQPHPDAERRPMSQARRCSAASMLRAETMTEPATGWNHTALRSPVSFLWVRPGLSRRSGIDDAAPGRSPRAARRRGYAR